MNFPTGFSIVLVEPEQGVNVGFVARTMACYGVTELRIVGSGGLGNSDPARKTAKGATQILENIRPFNTLAEAIGDSHFAFGFTRRTREPAQRIFDLDSAIKLWCRSQSSKGHAHTISQMPPVKLPMSTALVFGRESQGLSREETLALSHLVRIPMPDEILSLNLSHAVAIVLYAFFGTGSAPVYDEAAQGHAEPPPRQAERAVVLEKLTQALAAQGFFKNGKASAQKDYARLLWQRLQPTQGELDFLAGMLKRLDAKA